MVESQRLIDKQQPPTDQQIHQLIGAEALVLLERLEEELNQRYDLKRELRFPFGQQYGWGYRYAHKKKLLCYLFFEAGGITCTLSINDKGAVKVEALLDQLQPHMQKLWQQRYPCGKVGGWLHPKIKTPQDVADILVLIAAKK